VVGWRNFPQAHDYFPSQKDHPRWPIILLGVRSTRCK